MKHIHSLYFIPLIKTAVSCQTFGVNIHLASELHSVFPMMTPSQSAIFAQKYIHYYMFNMDTGEAVFTSDITYLIGYQKVHITLGKVHMY